MPRRDNGLPPIAGTFEAAEILDVAKSHIKRLEEQGVIPEGGDVRLKCGPIWLVSTIKAARPHVEANRKAK